MMSIKRLTVCFFIVPIFLFGCTASKQENDTTCLPVLITTLPSKIQLHSFDKKRHIAFVMESNGKILYDDTSIERMAEPVLVRTLDEASYRKLLELSRKVIQNNYSYKTSDQNSLGQVVYELSFGDTWNLLSVRVLVESQNGMPIELKQMIDYFVCLKDGDCSANGEQ